jgi:alkyl hydroperoxide reductase subunit AhpC
MLQVGEKFPAFSLNAAVSGDDDLRKAFRTITDLDYPGKWKVYFFWPADFSLLCPTEIVAFAQFDSQFQERNVQVLGGSTDSEWVHRAWRATDSEIKKVTFPMLADVKKDLCGQLGILSPNGMAQRATFLVDPEGVIRSIHVSDGAVGRNPEEVLRLLDAIQTGSLCASGWKKGDANMKIA